MTAGRQETVDPSLKVLSELPADTRGVIAQLKGGMDFVSRLAALGFTIGAEVTVAQNFGRGPLIVALRGTRVALGRGEATKVLVAEVGDGAR